MNKVLQDNDADSNSYVPPVDSSIPQASALKYKFIESLTEGQYDMERVDEYLMNKYGKTIDELNVNELRTEYDELAQRDPEQNRKDEVQGVMDEMLFQIENENRDNETSDHYLTEDTIRRHEVKNKMNDMLDQFQYRNDNEALNPLLTRDAILQRLQRYKQIMGDVPQKAPNALFNFDLSPFETIPALSFLIS